MSDLTVFLRRVIERLKSDLTPEDRAELRLELESWVGRGLVQVGPFVVDVETCAGTDTLLVEIVGRASIHLKSNEDGVSVDVYPPRLVDEPVAAIWMTPEDLEGEHAC